MTDLFGKMSNLVPKVGQSNGQFLGWLAENMSTPDLRAKAKAEWPDLNNEIARANLRFKGRG